jgi:hypothetical protein
MLTMGPPRSEAGDVTARFEIRVRGRLTRSLASEFERLDLSVCELPVETMLGGTFEDQSALYGMLRQLEGLGLELMEVRRIRVADDQRERGAAARQA